jgi:plastocyanin
MRKLLVVIPVALVAAAIMVVPAESSTSVSVKDNFFSPKVVSVRHGSTVKWVWKGHVAHNVTIGRAHSRTQSHGTFSHKFARKGTFRYRCTIHQGMTGTIKVK